MNDVIEGTGGLALQDDLRAVFMNLKSDYGIPGPR